MNTRNKPFSTATWNKRACTAVTVSVQYDDGRTEYFVLPQDRTTDDDAALRVAREKQESGELSRGCIAAIKRSR